MCLPDTWAGLTQTAPPSAHPPTPARRFLVLWTVVNKPGSSLPNLGFANYEMGGVTFPRFLPQESPSVLETEKHLLWVPRLLGQVSRMGRASAKARHAEPCPAWWRGRHWARKCGLATLGVA